ncbi:hypothetical protein DYB26_006986 [Aphanomyces astaci]|uniref:Uncharacterized protein n=3 Tax=Aphanomyces astaci TaxID=112090 RepID=A0A3R7B7R2_APHAT|nr:hypothetical protein DYB26_006986 [Aphanomyces astaci]
MCVKAGYVAAPMLDETSFDAATHFEFILETLKWYGQSDASIEKWFVCLIGDNCSTNKATENLFLRPLIGSHSHRLKLAVDQFLKANVSDVLSEVTAVLRFRNPVEMAVTAFAALPTEWALLGYLLTQLHVRGVRSSQYDQRYILCTLGLAVVDLPLLIFSPDSWVELGYSLDLLLAIAMSHAFIVIHVVLPLTNDAYGMGLGSHTGTFQGTMAILDEYLRTPNGVLYFRTQAPGCLGVDEIYQQHFAPFSLETIVPDNIRTRYSKAFQANDKYAVNPKSLSLNWNYYDVLQDSVATFMVTDLLPRFQKHELGAGWTDFVARHHTEHVLEVMLQNEAMYTFPDETLIKTKKNRLSLIESQQDSIKAQSINGNKNQKKKQPLESIKTASRLGKLVSIPSEKDSVDTPRPGT